MANNQAIAAVEALGGPKATAAIDGAQMLAVAMVAGEDVLRHAMQKHPYAVIWGCGLFPLIKSSSREA
jgi:hypothetical protein